MDTWEAQGTLSEGTCAVDVWEAQGTLMSEWGNLCSGCLRGLRQCEWGNLYSGCLRGPKALWVSELVQWLPERPEALWVSELVQWMPERPKALWVSELIQWMLERPTVLWVSEFIQWMPKALWVSELKQWMPEGIHNSTTSADSKWVLGLCINLCSTSELLSIELLLPWTCIITDSTLCGFSGSRHHLRPGTAGRLPEESPQGCWGTEAATDESQWCFASSLLSVNVICLVIPFLNIFMRSVIYIDLVCCFLFY